MRARSNQVRIIAGRWRSRLLAFPVREGLRPTSDRVRETLFNWLAPLLPGASCLDLFAGSGALGFEAASRGARRVVMVERDRQVAQALGENRQRLDASLVEIRQQDAESYLCGPSEQFDVVFLDPPFSDAALLDKSINALTECGWLKDDARIYLELPTGSGVPLIPESWVAIKQRKAGGVLYQLYGYRRGKGAGGPEHA